MSDQIDKAGITDKTDRTENLENPLGRVVQLRVARFSEIGAWLEYKSEGILLPSAEVPIGTKVDDELTVFVYKDSKNRLTATVNKPLLTLHGYAPLVVADVNQYGAFVEWGVQNQLLIPFKEQHHRLLAGEKVVVRLYIDEKTDRLVGSTYVEKNLEPAPMDLTSNMSVEALVYEKTNKGYKVIVNQRWQGLIYHSDIPSSLEIGQTLAAYVLKVREVGKLDIRLRPEGLPRVEGASEELLALLKEKGGFLALHDKSEPSLIAKHTGMSKKTFKRAVGMLLKQKIVEITDKGIFLLKSH